MKTRDEKSSPLYNAADMQAGDILLYKNLKTNYYFHAAIVTEIDNAKGVYKIAHWLGKAEPYTLSETRLTPAESLKARDMELECFRLKDGQHIVKTLAILRQWLTWAVPYDKRRYAKAEAAVSKFFNVHSDQYHGVIFSLSPEERKRFEQGAIEQHRQEMERLFEVNYMDVVKYAARRDISPVMPKEASEYQTGFNCLQGVLTVFQAACGEDYVQSVQDRWLSNKYVSTNKSLAPDATFFADASTALKQNFDLQTFLASFPKAFKLHAKTCGVETFRHALYTDKKFIIPLGTLAPLANDQIHPDLDSSNSACLIAKISGDAKRNALQTDVITPSRKLL
jgi:hypothetical protein